MKRKKIKNDNEMLRRRITRFQKEEERKGKDCVGVKDKEIENKERKERRNEEVEKGKKK